MNVIGIRIEKRDSMSGIGRFDIILANINLRVILENMEFHPTTFEPNQAFL